MKIYYTDRFVLPLPLGHRFPMEQYALLRAKVQADSIGKRHSLLVPEPVSDEEIRRAHDPKYLDAVVNGKLTPAEQRRIGFPWSAAMVERSRRSSGATLAAARAALQYGVAVNLAGGTHHAHRDHGAGYCVFNDSAIAARALRAERRVERIAIIDCDVHQGDGTAAILSADPSIFTFSIHAANNYPHPKQESDLDIALPDGTGDDAYLDALDRGLDTALLFFRPNLVIYLAGADPYRDDRLGRLALTFEGLAQRDRLVLRRCLKQGAAVAITMAGGYARNISDTAEIHLETVRSAAACAAQWG
ncbi:MAG TPA: histone deacetylase [Burkholderiales bacterium]|nr:histone deacetylase [Burkholderiales bacterium]